MQGTKHFGIHYATSSPLELVGFTDYDWDGYSTDINSTSGYVYMVLHGFICWSSKKQHTISLSSDEAGYRGAMNASTQCVWLQGILGELGFAFDSSAVIWCENKIKINICTNIV